MSLYISGIQQCGIGVVNASEAALYYKELLGFDCLVFDDIAEASLMTKYTGNKIYSRRAILTMNMQGGGGLELWQFMNRTPLAPKQKVTRADIGISVIKIKTRNIEKAFAFFKNRHQEKLTTIELDLALKKRFFLEDKFQNTFEIVEVDDFFTDTSHVCGGVYGAIIGVSNLAVATIFYQNILHSAKIIAKAGHHLIFKNEKSSTGAFSNLLGAFEVELVQATNLNTNIYEDRYWGDLGFIHLCLDIVDMSAYKQHQLTQGNIFTVDSEGFFGMDKAGGRFCYIEDADGTLIELVETYKVPIIKKMGWYLNLKKRKSKNPLPSWMLKLLGLSKVK